MSRAFRLFARAAAILILIVVAIVVAAAWWAAQPLRLPASPYAFDVKPGASLRSIARDLANAGVLPTEYALVLPARLRRADRAIKAGNYEIAEGVTLWQLLDKLTQGDVTQTAMTVVEGSTYGELVAALKASAQIAKSTPELPVRRFRLASAFPMRTPRAGSFPTPIFSRRAPRIWRCSRAAIA